MRKPARPLFLLLLASEGPVLRKLLPIEGDTLVLGSVGSQDLVEQLWFEKRSSESQVMEAPGTVPRASLGMFIHREL